jgi:hypothetical protein
MFLCAARVAPEKAVFRPALPLHSFQPECNGEHMAFAKKTYAEQLKHPNWQRRRLEMLQRAEFKCELCDDSESTLHVHHKRYVKGRQVWEYENDELQVLCESCHAEHHEMHGLLEQVLAGADGWDIHRTALGLVAGYMTACYSLDYELSERAREAAGPSFNLGILAAALALSPKTEVVRAVRSIRRDEVSDPVLEQLLASWGANDSQGGPKE